MTLVRVKFDLISMRDWNPIKLQQLPCVQTIWAYSKTQSNQNMRVFWSESKIAMNRSSGFVTGISSASWLMYFSSSQLEFWHCNNISSQKKNVRIAIKKHTSFEDWKNWITVKNLLNFSYNIARLTRHFPLPEVNLKSIFFTKINNTKYNLQKKSKK